MSNKTTTFFVLGALTILLAASLAGVLIANTSNNNDSNCIPVGFDDEQAVRVESPNTVIANSVTTTAAPVTMAANSILTTANDADPYVGYMITVKDNNNLWIYGVLDSTMKGTESVYTVFVFHSYSPYGKAGFQLMTAAQLDDLMSKGKVVRFAQQSATIGEEAVMASAAPITASADTVLTTANDADPYIKKVICIEESPNHYWLYLIMDHSDPKFGADHYFVVIFHNMGSIGEGGFGNLSTAQLDDLMSKGRVTDLNQKYRY